MHQEDCLIEIGVAELPPRALESLSEAFLETCQNLLKQQGFSMRVIHPFAAPRRLALFIEDLQTITEDRTSERRGPALKAGFGADGQPTNALLGFARSCGVEVDRIRVIQTEKGDYCVADVFEKGLAVCDVLPGIVEESLKRLPVAKMMRWGDSVYAFVRPIHWVVLLLGSHVVPGTVLGVKSSRYSRGHRFHHPEALEIQEPRLYAEVLEHQGCVIADYRARKMMVHQLIKEAARPAGGEVHAPDALLSEVTSIVEWPFALLCRFNPDFLTIPQEALMASMQGHQKCFPILDAHGKCLPYFVAVSHIKSRDPSVVIHGNECVMRARLSDAAFFFEKDRQVPLESRVEALSSVNFHRKLGSLRDKVNRLVALASTIASLLQEELQAIVRVALLCKADVMTDMVGEFPELQGTMGRYYAMHQGESTAVCQAIDEHYWPRFSGDHLPISNLGRIIAIADRLDHLVNLFSVGEKPTGEKDPFAMRRAAIGLVKILLEAPYDIDLKTLLELAKESAVFPSQVDLKEVLQFCLERLRALYFDQGFSPQLFDAVSAVGVDSLRAFDRRLKAVAHFLKMPEASYLLAGHKRIQNILSKKRQALNVDIALERLELIQEQDLYQALKSAEHEGLKAFHEERFEDFFTILASLKTPLDQFFEHVMVMVEDQGLRQNRLALLTRLSLLFRKVVDFSHLA